MFTSFVLIDEKTVVLDYRAGNVLKFQRVLHCMNVGKIIRSYQPFYSCCASDVTKNFENEAAPSWGSYVSFNMAATDVLNCDSKSILSAYDDSLQGNIKIRRKNSINWLQFDPFLIPLHNCSNECLPPVKAADLLSNLLLDTSVCTKGQF